MSIAQPCIKALDIWVKFIAFMVQINTAHIPCQATTETGAYSEIFSGSAVSGSNLALNSEFYAPERFYNT